MGEEINNKMYFKDEDGNMQEIECAEYFNLTKNERDNIKINSSEFDAKLASKNVFIGELSVSFSDGEKIFSRIRKTLGYSILKPKRFKKLLMSKGFSRNQAEQINKFFVYNHEPRYEYYIDLYSDNIKNMRAVLAIWR